MGLTLQHTAESGTVLLGARKGDGVYDTLVAAGQRWRGARSGPYAGELYLPHTRDKAALRGRINQAADALRAAGHAVEVTIDDTPRSQDDVRADRADRAEDRADRFADLAARRTADADGAFARADQISERRPFGQPILVGHHSERGARADQRRIENAMDRGCDNMAKARYHEHRADAAAHTAQAARRGDNPVTVANRIKKAEADLRGIQRDLDGYTRNFRNGAGEIHYTQVTKPATGEWRTTLESRREFLLVQLETDKADLAAREAVGEITIYTADKLKGMTEIKTRGFWRTVVKVNRTTVSVTTGYSWTDKVSFQEIKDAR